LFHIQNSALLINLMYFKIIILFCVITIFSECKKKEQNNVITSIEGTWRVAESSNGGQQNYIVQIIEDTANANLYFIDNFLNFGISHQVTASKSSTNLSVSNYMLDGNLINADGTISADLKNINWNYTSDNGSGSIIYSATYTKY